MRRHPLICLLIAGLLIFSLTGQAAAAFRMACEGTTACCCLGTATMPDMADAMTPMDGGCCNTPEPQPCDLAGPVSAPAIPFLPTEINSAPDKAPALYAVGATSALTIDGGARRGIPIRPPSMAGPPIYLQTQTFLC